MPRRGCDLLKSVIAYLNWRVESARVPFVSWRNQPAEVGCLTHAINLCNQALSDPRPVYDAEREQLRLELGAALESAKLKMAQPGAINRLQGSGAARGCALPDLHDKVAA